jgi:hypothetical protein
MLQFIEKIDFVSAWKAIAIALTGAFGILGLLTEFREPNPKHHEQKHTGKISFWGWVSLVGIVVSTICGVGAQIKESSDDATKALAIAKKSDNTLKQVQRILTPIDDPKIRLHFVLDCKQRSEYNDWCNKPQAQNGSSFGPLGVAILFFADPKAAQAFIDGQPNSVDAWFLTQLPAESSPLESGHATLIITNAFQPVEVSKRGNFNSIVDFPGATLILIISRGPNELAGLTKINLDMRFKSGDDLSLDGPFQEFPRKEVGTVYRYIFPKDSPP